MRGVRKTEVLITWELMAQGIRQVCPHMRGFVRESVRKTEVIL